MVIKRFEIYWVNLDPTVGREMQKTRPAVVISPDEANDVLGTVIIAPVTSVRRGYPTRILLEHNGKEDHIAIDQIRAVDKTRLARKISVLDEETAKSLCRTLQEMFAY